MHVVKKLVFVYSMIRDSYTVGKRARSAASANHEPSRTREERGLRYVEVRLQDICFDDLDQLHILSPLRPRRASAGGRRELSVLFISILRTNKFTMILQ